MISEIVPFMRETYPDFTNHTCGLHVHMSFKSSFHYQRLMTPSFPNTLIHYLHLWGTARGISGEHRLFKRLKGSSEYATLEYFADRQVGQKKTYARSTLGHRYTAVNYCFKTHGTLESRILPMFESVEDSISAILHTINVTNAFLAASKEREPRGKFDLDVTDYMQASCDTSEVIV